MIEVEFIWVVLPGVRAHPFQPRQLLPDLHQHLSFWTIEWGIAVESSWERAPPNSAVRAPLLTSSRRSPDMPVPERSSRTWSSFTWPFFSCGLAGATCLPFLRGLLVLQLEGFLCSGISFGPSQQISGPWDTSFPRKIEDHSFEDRSLGRPLQPIGSKFRTSNAAALNWLT